MGPQTAEPPRRRVLLVDDHPVVRRGLALILESEGFAVPAAVPDLAAARAALRRADADGAAVDAVVVDLSLEAESGMALVAELREAERPVPTVVYSVHEEGAFIRGAFAAGAMGYATKREDPEVLVACLRAALAGEVAPSPRAARALGERPGDADGPRPVDTLSMQELKVYRLMGDGLDTPDIAVRLDLSARTVETYYDRMLTKLRIQSRRELRRRAVLDARLAEEPPA